MKIVCLSRFTRLGRALLIPAVASFLFTSCAPSDALREDVERLKQDLQQAQKMGAIKCAPKEMAMAETHTDFTETELNQGNYWRAEEHAKIAKENIRKAIDMTDPVQCTDKQVIIKEPVVQVVRVDTDQDGLFDDEDECPQDKGPKENKGCPYHDTDADGIIDPEDKCPKVPGPKENNGCPYEDTDKDGIIDPEDKCPQIPGPKENNGCPYEDTDADGLIDPKDKCPNTPGPKENEGCPYGDKDNDTVYDHLDKCPDVPGDPKNNGCPKQMLVVVKDNIIEIKQQVHFQTNKAKILKDSYVLLNQVASVLRSNPQMKIRIEGHTDNVGNATYNMTLSQKRADAVREHLIFVEKIETQRLESQGFGLTKPVASNGNAKGRALNRRVEFHITAK